MNNSVIVVLLVLSCSYFAVTSPVLSNDSLETSTVNNDLMQHFHYEAGENLTSEYVNRYIEKVKSRILQNLHKTEAPRTHVQLPVLQTLNFRLEEKPQQNEFTYSEFRINTTKRTKSQFLYADVDDATCFDQKGSRCVRFHFNIPLRAESQDLESVELWLYKRQGITEYEITRIIDENGEEEERLTATVDNQDPSEGWTRFNMLQMVCDGNMTTLDLEIHAESGEWSLKFDENTAPFMLIKTEAKSISKRNARDCTSENSTCCRVKYYIRFEDVGWSEWIVHPDEFEANYCRGSCVGSIELPFNHHGQVMAELCERKPSKARDMGKQECISCSPTVYQPVSVIYLDEDGVQVISHMPNMSVTECGCI